MQWFTIIQTVVMALAAAGVALLYRGFQTGKWVQNVDAQHDEIVKINQRLDKAGQEMSDLANDIQKLPDQLRNELVSKEVFAIHQTIAKEQRDALWEAIRARPNFRR